MKWSHWSYALEDNPHVQHPNCAGVYRIRLVDTAGRPVPIGRLLGQDKDGILGVGHSGDLQERVANFFAAAYGRRFKHSAGNRWFLVQAAALCSDKLTATNRTGLQLSTARLGSKDQAQEKEGHILVEYFRQYGELPPLNAGWCTDWYSEFRRTLESKIR